MKLRTLGPFALVPTKGRKACSVGKPGLVRMACIVFVFCVATATAARAQGPGFSCPIGQTSGSVFVYSDYTEDCFFKTQADPNAVFLDLVMSAGVSPAYFFALVDPYGHTLATAECGYPGTELNTIPLSYGGTYTVDFYSCGGPGNGTVGFSIYIQSTNSPVGAVSLPFGQTQSGAIGSAAQQSTYTFSANAGDVVSFTMTATSGALSPRIRLYNPAGQTLADVANGNINGTCFTNPVIQLNNVRLPSTGTYTVLVGDCGDTNTGNYNIVMHPPAHKDKVLHSFTGPDGAGIMAGLVSDAAGNLYGVAWGGGANGLGSVFELSRQGDGGWTFSVLYSFQNDCKDGSNPTGTLVFDAAGNLYGTTAYGGPYSTSCNPATGYGTVFELTPPTSGSGSWTETILHNFTSNTNGSIDGANPQGGVILDAKGNLYGTTQSGGYGVDGTVFVLIKDRGWEGHVMWPFGGGVWFGAHPMSGLVMDAAGNLYGTTPNGGDIFSAGEGYLFGVTPGTDWDGTSTGRYQFLQDGGTGTNPYGNLIIDADGNLYGTTQGTGAGILAVESEVFELSSEWELQVLYRFKGNGDGRDIMSGLVLDSAGSLYGTSYMGGTNVNCPAGTGNPPTSCGTVFKLTRGTGGVWTEQQLHSFSDDGDGFWPLAGLIFGTDGNLYGTTYAGGDVAACTPNPSQGCGTVFEITP
jgi:uncharacterized repeat protein (TIGR03803 family)